MGGGLKDGRWTGTWEVDWRMGGGLEDGRWTEGWEVD